MNKKFILLIDDNKDIRDALVSVLEELGYSIITAANGQVGLELLERDPLPSLIILDLMMPVMDGFQFREKQKANPRIRDIPVVIASAKKNLDKYFSPSPNKRLLAKPFNMEHLLEIVEHYCKD